MLSCGNEEPPLDMKKMRGGERWRAKTKTESGEWVRENV